MSLLCCCSEKSLETCRPQVSVFHTDTRLGKWIWTRRVEKAPIAAVCANFEGIRRQKTFDC